MLLLCLMPALLPGPARAEETDAVWEAQTAALDTAGLERLGQDYLDGVTLDPAADLDGGLALLWQTLRARSTGIVRDALRSGVLLLAVALLCACADALWERKGEGLNAVRLAGALGVTALAGMELNTITGLGREALANMDLFSKALLPVLTAAAAASGSPTAATMRQVATMFASDLLLTAGNRLLLPLIYAFVAVSMVCAAAGNPGLRQVAALLKWTVTTILSVLLMAFVGYLLASRAIAGPVDAAAVKAARFALSGAIPVVGGILRDASEVILAGAGILRGAVGLFGMLVILAICLTPFLQMAAHYLVYKAAAALAAVVADPTLAELIGAIGGAFALLMGLMAASGLVLLCSIVSAVTIAAG